MAADQRSRTETSRRSYMKAAGVTALSTAFVGTGSAVSSDIEDQYGTVIDVTNEGADPNGNESITPIIEELADDDTLLKFPSGEYYIDKRVRVTNCENFGMIGDDATLVPASFDDFDDSGDWNYKLFRLGVDYDPVTDLRVENFTVDMTADNTGVRVIEAAADDGMIIRDIDIVGVHDSGAWGPGRFVITDSDGSGLVERFKAPDGAVKTENAPGDELRWGPTGILSNTNRGTMTFRDCHLGGFPDNGLYASHGSGSIQIIRGHFENSAGANVRIGGKKSKIIGTKIIVDEETNLDDRAQVGLEFEDGEWVAGKNLDIRVSDPTSPAVWVDSSTDITHLNGSSIEVQTQDPATAISIRPGTGKTFIQRSDITHETGGGAAVKIKEGGVGVTFRESSVVGTAETEGYYSAIHNNRDDCDFLNLNVNHGDDSGRHALTTTGNDCIISGGTYISKSEPIVERGDGTRINDVETRTQ